MTFRIAVLINERPNMHRAEFFDVEANSFVDAQLELYAHLKERNVRRYKGVIKVGAGS